MSISEAVIKRRSTKKFNMEPLSEALVDQIADYIADIEVPDTSIDWDFDTLPYEDMEQIIDAPPFITAPHYLVLRAEEKMFRLQTAGFIGELACLKMAELGVSSMFMSEWGASKDFEDSLPFVISIAFGMSDEPFRTDISQAKRKPLSDLVSGDWEPYSDILESARLAPSYRNLQPITYNVSEHDIHIFRRKVFFLDPITNYAECIDAGVAMGQIYAAGLYDGHTVRFRTADPKPDAGKKSIYQITAVID